MTSHQTAAAKFHISYASDGNTNNDADANITKVVDVDYFHKYDTSTCDNRMYHK